jgi:hypothetical protein
MSDNRNPWLSNLRPMQFRRGEWTPEAYDPRGPESQPNSRLIVSLPGEQAQSTVLRVVSNDAVIVELGSVLNTNKSHDYKAKDIIPVRRERDDFGGDRWSAVSERELQQAEVVERFEAAEKAKAEAKDKELAERAAAQGLQAGEVGAEEELLRVVGPEKRGG